MSGEAESLQMAPIEYSRTSFPSLSKTGPLLTWPMFKYAHCAGVPGPMLAAQAEAWYGQS